MGRIHNSARAGGDPRQGLLRELAQDWSSLLQSVLGRRGARPPARRSVVRPYKTQTARVERIP